ncbi:MAG: MucB/RseB C-terminal domain-containing protein [Halofilum sp. (in: g-proteobacteria)]|nr:MucB/RseB C-terminal domain-containing protein [Halofilum sp. (in: g-proteobacteria)]
MAEAMRASAYEGTLVYTHDGHMEAMSVVHGVVGGVEHERLRTLSGQPFELVRAGSRLTCVWPASRRALVSQRPGDLLPPRPPRGLEQLPEPYTAAFAGEARMTGRTARIVDVRPRDRFRYGYRMWIDRATGLLLRSDMVVPGGEPVERLMFTELRPLESVSAARFEPTLEGMEYVRHGSPEAGREALEDPRWRVSDLPAGFRAVSHRREALPPHGRALQHSVFTDGLASVSVFVEPPDAGAMPLEGLSRMGAVHAYGVRRDDYHVTVVGEVPAATVRRIARSVEPAGGAAGGCPGNLAQQVPGFSAEQLPDARTGRAALCYDPPLSAFTPIAPRPASGRPRYVNTRSLRTHVVAAVLLVGLLVPAHAPALPDFTRLVEREHAAVVNISTSREIRPNRGDLPPGFDIPELEDSPFGELFRRFFGEDAEPRYREDTASLGSGFIISEDGYVLTNGHVVAEADRIRVRMHDRRQFEAEVVGIDDRSDIALLKVDARDLPTVTVGDPAELRVGEWVLAIGSPFGFERSVTQGIVSAKGRSLPRDNYVPFIQTDVAINPGNSGGPLFNLDGEVVGVNAQIYSRTGGFMGLSFAIPIDVAMDVADQLRAEGKVTRGWLGVVIQEVTRELAQSFGMERAHGALVARVLPGSPAARAGLQVGDVIVAFNGREVPRSSALPPMVGRTAVGEKARVEVVRDGERRTLRVRIGRLPGRDELAEYRAPGRSDDPDPRPAPGARLGLRVAPVDDATRRELDIGDGGVRVTEVDEGPAASAGVEAGDVLVMMNSRPIRGVEDFRARVAELPGGRSVALLIQRASGPQFVAVEVPEGD